MRGQQVIHRKPIQMVEFHSPLLEDVLHDACVWLEEFERNVWDVAVHQERRNGEWWLSIFYHPVGEGDGGNLP